MARAPENVLGHWSQLVAGLQASPTEFYAAVDAAIARRTIPNATVGRTEYREGGAFSGLRLYLNVTRQRDTIDICGAPFGNGFFFSWWHAEAKTKLPALASVLIVFGYLVLVGLFARWFGMFAGPAILLCLVPLLLAAASQMGKPETDDLILSLPLIGKAYEWLFRPITYYRIDTSEMFQQAVTESLMEVIDAMTSAKGIRALTESERKPVMRGFFSR